MASRLGSVDPSRFVDETFELYSIPAFDRGSTDILLGMNIGSSKQIVQANDVMLSKIVPHIRRAWVVGQNIGYRQIASGEWIVFRNADVLPEYLKHLLISDEFHSKFMRTVSGVGGSLLRARPSEVAKIKIPLPSFNEQQSIASILDKANEIKNKRERTIAMLSGLVGSIFEEKFGNPINNTFNWKIAKLVDVCDRTGEYGAGVSSREYSADLPRYIRITDITEAGLLEDKKVSPNGDKNDWQEYVLNEGDIVFARSGATVGKTYLHRHSDEEHIFAGYLIRFRPNRKIINSDYLFAFTKTNFYKAWVKSRQNVVAQPNINAKQYGYDLELPVPPIALQNTFANEIASINSNLVSQKMALDKINTLIKSLQNQAFATGFNA
jgi:type I restriction enzyme S subunit